MLKMMDASPAQMATTMTAARTERPGCSSQLFSLMAPNSLRADGEPEHRHGEEQEGEERRPVVEQGVLDGADTPTVMPSTTAINGRR
jgi:hypothetical protein